MANFDLQNDDGNAGSALRNEAANYLSSIYGAGQTEVLIEGKRVDGVFRYDDLGSDETIVLEAKDYARPLHREEVVAIWSDYEPVLRKLGSAKLLIVTKRGLAPGAQAYVGSQPSMRHTSVWELEDRVLGLRPYIQSLTTLFDEDGLSQFYVDPRADFVTYAEDMTESLRTQIASLPLEVSAWIAQDHHEPLAILGGYGAGKSSFAKSLISSQAKLALADPSARRPILIRLGAMARYNSLEGLLGAMFTSQHAVRGYNFSRFLDFNAKGRFLIVLDGFDEMKHAMSFAEFRSQISEFNQLVVSGSKVVLLGRPSAFTTDAEQHHVLRGQVHSIDRWRKLPDWPEFLEYQLADFTTDEGRIFLDGFLRFHAGRQGPHAPDADWVDRRVAEVSALAKQDAAVFGRPVHLKILAELAADARQDLEQLRRNVSRWSLYDEFFRSLARREAEKPARTPIGEESRLAFLQEIAFWLWREKSAKTSFVSDEIPRLLLDKLPDGDAADVDTKRREYLSGSFLERKSGDIYYFPHRSFAEFLVAARMLYRPPQPAEHRVYGQLATEGVAEFLTSPENKDRLRRWPETIANAQGPLSPEYLKLLIDAFGGAREINEAFTSETHWRLPLQLIGAPLRAGGMDMQPLRGGLLSATPVELALSLQLLAPNGYVGFKNGDDRGVVAHTVAGVLLERLLRLVREPPDSARFTVEGEAGELERDLSASTMTSLGATTSGRAVTFSWIGALEGARAISLRAGASIEWDGPYESALHQPQELALDRVLSKISSDFRARAQVYLTRLRSLKGITIVQRQPLARRKEPFRR